MRSPLDGSWRWHTKCHQDGREHTKLPQGAARSCAVLFAAEWFVDAGDAAAVLCLSAFLKVAAFRVTVFPCMRLPHPSFMNVVRSFLALSVGHMFVCLI